MTLVTNSVLNSTIVVIGLIGGIMSPLLYANCGGVELGDLPMLTSCIHIGDNAWSWAYVGGYEEEYNAIPYGAKRS